MNKLNAIGVDLAKNVIQVSVLSPTNRELRNSSLTRRKFAEFLTRQRPSLVAFEACATAHYWARFAQRLGHEVKIIPAKTIAPFRQGQWTFAYTVMYDANVKPLGVSSHCRSVHSMGKSTLRKKGPDTFIQRSLSKMYPVLLFGTGRRGA